MAKKKLSKKALKALRLKNLRKGWDKLCAKHSGRKSGKKSGRKSGRK